MFRRKKNEPETMIIKGSTAFKSGRKELAKQIDKLEKQGWITESSSTAGVSVFGFPETTVILKRK